MSNLDFDVGGFPPETVTARRAGVAAQDANPDSAAKAFDLAPKVGLPPSIVQYDVDGFASRAQQDQNNALVDAHPKLAEFVSDPAKAAAVKDDYGPLAQISATLDPGGYQGTDEPGPLLSGVGSGFSHANYQRFATAYQAGVSSLEPTLRGYESEFEKEKRYTGFQGYVNALGSFIGGTASSAAVGGGAGAVVGSVAGPAGAVTGFTVGTLADMFGTTSGGLYRRIDLMRDAEGNPISEPVKQAVALAGGTIGVGLGMAAGGASGHIVGNLVGDALISALGRVGVAETIAAGTGAIAKSGITGGAINAGIALAQESNPIIAKRLSGQTFTDDPQEYARLRDSIEEAFLHGLPLFAGLHAIPIGVNYLKDRAAIAQTQIDAQQRLSILSAMEVSKTAQRAPELMREYIASHDYPDVQVSAEAVEANREHFNYIPDLDDQLARQLPVGGDITISAADYFTRTPPEVVGKLNEKVRGVSGLTPEEAQGLHENPPAYAEAPIAQFRRDADKINQDLPTPAEGTTRLWRGNRPDEVGTNSQFTNDLPGIALPFKKSYGGDLSYIDVPTADLGKYEQTTGAAPGAEFIVPSELAKTAQIVKEKEQPQIAEATENAVQSQRRAMWLDPILAPDATGTNASTFARMSKNVQEIQRGITKAAYDAAEREIKRRETPLWKDNLRKEIEAAREEMAQRPDFKAWHGLVELPKDDPFSVKLDRNEVDALYNRESPGDYAAFTKDGSRASESLPAKMFGSDGLHPDEAAGFFGFNSGKEMLDQLRQHEANIRESGTGARPYFEGLVKAEAARRMEAKHGNLGENIMHEAMDEALSVKQVDVLIDEFKALGGDKKITRERVNEAAKEIFGGLKAETVKADAFTRRVGKFGEEAFRAANAGKSIEALKAKQRQLINFVMAREARVFERERAAIEKLTDRYGNNANIASVDQSFTDQVHSIMANIGLRVPRSEENLRESLTDKSGKSITLERFIDDVHDKTGLEVIPADVLRPQDGKVKKYSDYNVDEARQLKDTLTSLDHGGRQWQKVQVLGKEQEFKNLADAAVEQLATMERDIDNTRRDAIGQMKTGGRWIDASMIKAEQLFQWLDKNEPLGLITKLFYRGLKESEHRFLDAFKDAADRWNREVAVDPAWTKKMNTKVKNTALMGEDYAPETIYRDNMIAMALNIGNEWNLRVLTKGRDWHPDDLHKFLMDNMTKEDWDHVQKIWDFFEPMWPDVRDAAKRRSGVAPERIPAREIETPHGTYKGGYYPLFEVPRDAQGMREKAFGADQARPFQTLKSVSSATQARTGAAYRVDLSLGRLPYMIRETLHEVHMGQALMDTAKFLGDKEIRKGIDKAFGPEYTDSLKPWFSYIATDGGAADPSSLGWLTAGSRYLRQNMVTQLVGFRSSTGAIHGLSASFNSWTELAKEHIGDNAYLLEANKALFKNPVTGERYAKEFLEESGELRHRFHNMDRDTGAVLMRDLTSSAGLGKVLGNQYDRALYQSLATKHIMYLDYASALAVYAGRRAKALAEGMSKEDAIWTAGQSVRNAHGSAGMLDLPAIARQAEGWKWFTTFYGYFNHNYQRLRDTARFARDADYMDPATYWNLVSRSIGYLVAPAIIHEMFRGQPKKQDESWAWWLTKGGISQITSTAPGIRDLAHGLLDGKVPDQISPLGEVYKGVTGSLVDVHKFIAGDKSHSPGQQPKDWLSKALQTPGWITGHLPGATGSGLGRVISGVTTKTGSGYPQYLWDRQMHTPDSWDADFSRLFWDGNYHHRRH